MNKCRNREVKGFAFNLERCYKAVANQDMIRNKAQIAYRREKYQIFKPKTGNIVNQKFDPSDINDQIEITKKVLEKLFLTYTKPSWKEFKMSQELLGDGLSYKSQSGHEMIKFFTTKIAKNKDTFDQLIDMVLKQDRQTSIDLQIKKILDESEKPQKSFFDFECSLVFTDSERRLVEEHKRMEYSDMLKYAREQNNRQEQHVNNESTFK